MLPNLLCSKLWQCCLKGYLSTEGLESSPTMEHPSAVRGVQTWVSVNALIIFVNNSQVHSFLLMGMVQMKLHTGTIIK